MGRPEFIMIFGLLNTGYGIYSGDSGFYAAGVSLITGALILDELEG